MTQGELDRAKRRAMRVFDDWIKATGALSGGWLSECEGIIEDTVEIGVQEALGDRRPLESEEDPPGSLHQGYNEPSFDGSHY